MDIDKLYMSRMNYQKHDNGIVDTDVEDRAKRIQNNLLSDYITLLTDTIEVKGKKITRSMQLLHSSIDDHTEYLTDTVKDLEEGKEEDPVRSFDSYMLRKQCQVKDNFITGKFGIGPYALNNNNHILTMLYGVEFRIPKEHDTILSRNKMTSLHNSTDRDGNSILAQISGLINAHVDVAKDPYIGKLNINKYTYNLSNLLIRLGYGKSTLYFLTQPIMRALSNVYRNSQGVFMQDLEKSAYRRANDAEEEFIINYANAHGIEGDTKEQVMDNWRSKIGDSDALVDAVINDKELLRKIAKDNFGPTADLTSEQTYLINGEEYSFFDVQMAIYEAKLLFEPYAQALSQLVQYSKIDTNAHGKSLVEQKLYLEGFAKLFDPNSTGVRSMFNANRLDDLCGLSYIAKKTANATSLFTLIMGKQSIQGTTSFLLEVDRLMAATGHEDFSNERILKKFSNAIAGKLKSRWINEYAKKNNIDLLSLVNGNNTIYDRLAKIKAQIAVDPKYAALRNEDGEASNYMLRTLVNGYTKKLTKDLGPGSMNDVYNNAKFIDLFTFIDDESVDLDDFAEGWEELLYNENYPELQLFARDLIFYAFITSQDAGGMHDIFKFLPNRWKLDPDNEGLDEGEQYKSGSYAEYLDNLVRDNSCRLTDDERSDLMINNWHDDDFVPIRYMTRRKEQLLQPIYMGNLPPRVLGYFLGQPIYSNPETIPYPSVLCGIRKTLDGWERSFLGEQFIKVPRTTCHDYESQRRYNVYKRIGYGSRQWKMTVTDPETGLRQEVTKNTYYPIYVLVDAKGNRFAKNNRIYQYGIPNPFSEAFASLDLNPDMLKILATRSARQVDDMSEMGDDIESVIKYAAHVVSQYPASVRNFEREIMKTIDDFARTHFDLGITEEQLALASEWSKKEGWSVEYFVETVLPRIDEAWQIEFESIEYDDSIVPKQSFLMTFAYGKNKAPGIVSNTTFDAIKNGERTATTRYESDGHIDEWRKLNVGDIVEFTSANGEKQLVRITKPAVNLGEMIQDEEELTTPFVAPEVNPGKTGQSVTQEILVTESAGYYSQRTKENAEWSDITLAIAINFDTAGEKLTKRVAGDKYHSIQFPIKGKLQERYNFVTSGQVDAQRWARTQNIKEKFPNGLKLNVAGNGLYTLLSKGYTLAEANDYLYGFLAGLMQEGILLEVRSGGQTGIDEAGIVAAQRLGIKASIHAPKGFKFRNASGLDISDKEEFLSRFKATQNQANVIGDQFWETSGQDKFMQALKEAYQKVAQTSPASDVLLHIKKRDIPIIKELIAKRNPSLTQDAIDAAIDFLDSLENDPELNIYVKSCITWLKNNAILLPEDNETVLSAFKFARKYNLDVQKFKTPFDLILEVIKTERNQQTISQTPVNPNEIKEFSFAETIINNNGERIDIYDVEDTPEGRLAVSQVIADTSPKGVDGKWILGSFTSPWCLATFNYHQDTRKVTRSDSAERYWPEYNADSRRQIAFINGYPVGFRSTKLRGVTQWWDYRDITHFDVKEITSNDRFDVIDLKSKPNSVRTGYYHIAGATALMDLDGNIFYFEKAYTKNEISILFTHRVNKNGPVIMSPIFFDELAVFINKDEDAVGRIGNNFDVPIMPPYIYTALTDKKLVDYGTVSNNEHISVELDDDKCKETLKVYAELERLLDEFFKLKINSIFDIHIPDEIFEKLSELKQLDKYFVLKRQELVNKRNQIKRELKLKQKRISLQLREAARLNLRNHAQMFIDTTEGYQLENRSYANDDEEDGADDMQEIIEDDYLRILYNAYLNEHIIPELYEHLKKILEEYHIEYIHDDLREVFGDDVMGAFDVLNKIIYLSNTEQQNAITNVEEFAHAFIELMGSAYHKVENRGKYPKNMVYSQLRDEVVRTSLYRLTLEEYKDNPNYQRPDGSVDTAKVKKEALGKALAVAILNNYKYKVNTDQKDKSFFDKINQWLYDIILWFKEKLTDAGILKFKATIDDVAESIIKGTYKKKFIEHISTKGLKNVDYESTLANAPEKSKDIMRAAVRNGAIISGSISIRKQSPVYRKKRDTLHDIDIMVPFSVGNDFFQRHPHWRLLGQVPENYRLTNEQLVEDLNNTAFMLEMKADIPNLHVMYAYSDYAADLVVNAIVCEDVNLVLKFESLGGKFEERLKHFTKEERNKIYLVDFFYRKDDKYVQDAIRDEENGLTLANYKASFEAKLQYGRAKDVFDYQRLDPLNRTRYAGDILLNKKRGDGTDKYGNHYGWSVESIKDHLLKYIENRFSIEAIQSHVGDVNSLYGTNFGVFFDKKRGRVRLMDNTNGPEKLTLSENPNDEVNEETTSLNIGDVFSELKETASKDTDEMYRNRLIYREPDIAHKIAMLESELNEAETVEEKEDILGKILRIKCENGMV